MPEAPAERQLVLLRHLRARLGEVQLLLNGAPCPPLPLPNAPDDPEEVLRVVMVRLWPRVREQRASKEERRLYLDFLERLAGVAGGDDWRYLDALNVAYETLGQQTALLSAEEWRAFLARYLAALQARVARLGTAA